MKLFVAAIVVACLAVAVWVASISLQAVDHASPLVVGLTVWATVPALAVGIALVVVRARRLLVLTLGLGGLGVVVAGAAFEYHSIVRAPDAFTGPIVPLLLTPVVQGLALMFLFFVGATMARESEPSGR